VFLLLITNKENKKIQAAKSDKTNVGQTIMSRQPAIIGAKAAPMIPAILNAKEVPE
jgi:hypothetical protein